MNVRTTIAGAAIIIAGLGTAAVGQALAVAESGTYREQFSVTDIEVPLAWRANEPGWRL
jgi:hypothetical protein